MVQIILKYKMNKIFTFCLKLKLRKYTLIKTKNKETSYEIKQRVLLNNLLKI